MPSGRPGAILFGLVLLLGACGPKPASSPVGSPSATGEPLALAATTMRAGEVGLDYGGAVLQATGGVMPYQYQVVEGTFPPGLAMSRDGAVVGTPTTAGDFTFSVVVADSSGHAVSAQDVIHVVPALTLKANHSGTIYVESGCDTVCGGFATQSGGLGPYKYTLKSGTLPAGTSLGESALTGKFTSPGTYSFAIQVTDALGATAVVSPTFSVITHIYFYCPSPWPGGRGFCIPAGGSGAYQGQLTFSCQAMVVHSDCVGAMMFAGGSNGGWTVSYQVVDGMQPPSSGSPFGVPDPNAAPPPPMNILSVSMGGPPGTEASGTLLVTLSDGMVCGPGGTRCSTSAYVTWSVVNRSPY